MNTPTRPLITAWRAAADDLGIRIEVSFLLRTSSRIIEADLLVRDFGSVNGMLISGTEDVFNACSSDIVAAGYGYSVLATPYETYDRALFIDTLSDWSWTGGGNCPEWCSH